MKHEVVADGPMLVSFDPTDGSKRSSFLMFLTREKDGRYMPTGGQTDPGDGSVVPVPYNGDWSLTEKLNRMLTK
jgi:hypothetical protein